MVSFSRINVQSYIVFYDVYVGTQVIHRRSPMLWSRLQAQDFINPPSSSKLECVGISPINLSRFHCLIIFHQTLIQQPASKPASKQPALIEHRATEHRAIE
jgi:hypothetical protein